jgi:two-component system, cell cycle sensor histidine kinase and response regulator CckA
VRQVVAELEPMLRRLIGEDIALESRLGDGEAPHTVLADRGQLEQVLVNLVVNARDAMPRGGTITLGAADVELPPGFRTHDGEAPPGPYVVLSVRDTGHGMDRGTIEHIFEPFFTTKGPGHGTGLGLSTVHGIVRQSGGYVRVSSEPGRGTEFEIYLPRHRTADGAAAPAPSVARGSERLLVVEDDAAVRAVARRALEQLGYSVLEAANGREALERFRAHEGAIDLVVTDTVMPEMGAGELVARLRAERPALPVLYMSGYTDDAVARDGAEPAGGGFIQKPFTAQELGAAVRERLDRAAARAR